MGERGKKYDDDFKRKAVDHWISSRKSAKQAAADMDVSSNSLRLWRDKFISEEGGPQQENLKAENEKLKKEIAILREEKEILKKLTKCLHFSTIFLNPKK